MSKAPVPGTVSVVLVNYKGADDTITCLKAFREIDWPADKLELVVVDNVSEDGSVEKIQAAVPEAVVVASKKNLGFAGGCNVGLRYAMARGDCAYAWLLNNDTVVDPGALAALVRRLGERPDAGQCGSRVLYFDAPDRVQGWGGGRLDPWLGTVRRLSDGAPSAAAPDAAAVERQLDYVGAASMLVRASFVREVGLLEEGYFLYFEELDWAIRGARRGAGAFGRAYAHDSVVYHREGRSIGSHPDGRRTSELADYYALRNRLVFTRRFFAAALPTVYCGMLLAAANRLRRGQFRRALMVLRIMAAAPGAARTPPPPGRRESAASPDAAPT